MSEIRIAINEPKPVIYETQIQSMKRLIGDDEKFQNTEAWIRNFCIVVDNSAQMQDIHDAWARINENLRNAYLDRMKMVRIAPQRSGKTWLGSHLNVIDEHLRIPQVQEVPDVRDQRLSAGPFNLDPEGRLTYVGNGQAHWEAYGESDPVQLQEWLQHRSVCRRALRCGFPRINW